MALFPLEIRQTLGKSFVALIPMKSTHAKRTINGQVGRFGFVITGLMVATGKIVLTGHLEIK